MSAGVSREQQAQALAQVCPIAVKFERLHGLPAELTVAQVMLESAWLTKRVGKWNVLGMKRARRHKAWVWQETTEFLNDLQLSRVTNRVKSKTRMPNGLWRVLLDEQFADYASLEEAIADYAQLLTSPRGSYAQAWAKWQKNPSDWRTLARDVAIIYATGRKVYAREVIRIGGQSNVQEALEKEWGKPQHAVIS